MQSATTNRWRQLLQQSIGRNPWLVFLPFLVFFLLLIFLFPGERMRGDTGRYLIYAENLLRGSYAFEDTKYLWNGPGYPLLLVPLVAVGAPLLAPAMLNAVFHYLSVVFLFKTVRRHTKFSNALFFSLSWALYYPVYEALVSVLTETFTIFLVTMIVYFSDRYFSADPAGKKERRRLLWILGGLTGYLALTKIIFGYVLAGALVVVGLYWLLGREKENARRAASVLGIAFLVCLPYLFYTYQLTGRLFYWGNSGGLSLYWMSTPHANEYGDWQNPEFHGNWRLRDIEAIKANHQADFEALDAAGLDAVQRDDRLKEMALRNIRNHPEEYLVNWVANVNRLLFGMPYSFQLESLKFLKYLPPNLPLVTLMIYSLFVLALNFRRTPFGLRFVLLLAVIYLFLSSLVSAYPRMLYVINPVLFFWIAYSIGKTARFRFFLPAEK